MSGARELADLRERGVCRAAPSWPTRADDSLLVSLPAIWRIGDGAVGLRAGKAVIWLVPGMHRLHRVAHARFSPTLEELIFDFICWTITITLQAARARRLRAGAAPVDEGQRRQHVVIVDGSVPVGDGGVLVIAVHSNVDMLAETVPQGRGEIAVGTLRRVRRVA